MLRPPSRWTILLTSLAVILAACGPAKPDEDVANPVASTAPAAELLPLDGPGTTSEDSPDNESAPTTLDSSATASTTVPPVDPTHFATSFGPDMALGPISNAEGYGLFQTLSGSDGQMDWGDLPGTHIAYGPIDQAAVGTVLSNRIESTDGPDGQPTSALVLEAAWDGEQSALTNDFKVSFDKGEGRGTVSYQLWIPADYGTTLPTDGGQTFQEIFHITHQDAPDDPFDWSVAIARRPSLDGDLHWRVGGGPDLVGRPLHGVFNKTVIVPVGEWIALTFDFDLDPVEGFFTFTANGESVADFSGVSAASGVRPVVTILKIDAPPLRVPAQSVVLKMTDLEMTGAGSFE